MKNLSAWIVDGMKGTRVTRRYAFYDVDYSTCTYTGHSYYTTETFNNITVHCNWGWYGRYNGDYVPLGQYETGDGTQYKRGLKMISHITPLD